MPNDWPPRRSERLTGLIGGPRPGWRALGAPPRSAANGAAGEGEQVTPHEYMREIVAPTIEDLAATPSSRRHAFIACVVTFHALDYLAGTRRKAVLRAEYRRQSPAFAAIDRIAHAANRKPPGGRRPPQRVDAARPFTASGGAGGATAGDRRGDVLALVNAAAAFLETKIRQNDSRPDQPVNDTYYVVIPFDRDAEGDIRPGAAQEAINAAAAERRARALAAEHAGAVAFSRRGDPVTGELEDATILARFGEIDLAALGGGA